MEGQQEEKQNFFNRRGGADWSIIGVISRGLSVTDVEQVLGCATLCRLCFHSVFHRIKITSKGLTNINYWFWLDYSDQMQSERLKCQFSLIKLS